MCYKRKRFSKRTSQIQLRAGEKVEKEIKNKHVKGTTGHIRRTAKGRVGGEALAKRATGGVQ